MSDLVIRTDIVMMVPHPLPVVSLAIKYCISLPTQPALEVVLCRIIEVINILNNFQATLIVHLLYLSISDK